VGNWKAVDGDGSIILLKIYRPVDDNFRIKWQEKNSSFCSNGVGNARGTGQLLADDVLTADLHLKCSKTGETKDFQITWIYDSGTDTLSSGFVTWHHPSSIQKACLLPPSGLTGWWPGDGNAEDLIGGRNGIFHGDATTGSGLVDLAFKLDGQDDFIEVPHDSALDVGVTDFTIDLWVNFNDTSGEQVLVEKWIQGDPFAQGWTMTKLEDDVLRLAMATGTGIEVNLDTEPLSIRSGIWYHVAAVRQGTDVTLYLNGIPVAHDSGGYKTNLNSSSSLKFGHRGGPEDTPGSIDERGFYLSGRIDEVELLVGTALTEEQIMALYSAGSAGKCKD
jgi:hypothetical protein